MILTLLAWLLVLPVTVPALVFLAEVLLGFGPGRRRLDPAVAMPATAIVMPAHDEARTIGPVLARLLADLPPATRLLVVADNCSDDTAAIARSAGVEVAERHDPARRGKGWALAFGRDVLAADPPAVAVVLDADCVMAGADLARLSAASALWARPVQARYLFAGDLRAPPMVQVSNFALLVKNMIRQRGAARLGAPAVLGGTGMAFPWEVFAAAPLASGDLVEDLALGIDLIERGVAPRYLDEASVTSAASTAEGTLVQRTRWEHGFMATARTHGLRLLRSGVRAGDGGRIWAGLNLLTPPLALLMFALIGTAAVAGVLALIGAGVAPFGWAAALLVAVSLAVLLAWFRHGRTTLAAGTLVSLPLYLLWKLPIYLGFARRRETNWIRSERAD